MANPYIIIRNSVEKAAWDLLTPQEKADPQEFLGHKFRVVHIDFAPGYRKSGSQRETVGGRIDNTPSHIYYTFRANIRCSYQATTSDTTNGYGTYGDLLTYFKLEDPNPSGNNPNNLIYLTDHYGTEMEGYLIGEFNPNTVTTYVDGESSVFFIPVMFIKRDAE